MTTHPVTLSETPVAIAEGPGACTFEPKECSCGYAIATGEDTGADIDAWYYQPERETRSLELTAGETLYLRGRGLAAVDADIIPE